MNALLTIETPTGYGELLLLGLQVVAIGMATIFSVLIIIWAIIALFKLAIGGNKKTVSAESTNTNTAPAVAATAKQDNDEIVAVIAAAIAAAESESDNCKFKVVSFRRM